MNVRMKFLRRYIICGSGSPPVLDTFTYFELSDTEESTEFYTGENTTPTVPNTHSSKAVKWVGSQTFSGNTDVTSVTISNGIEQIR